jgi:hypothetical protein
MKQKKNDGVQPREELGNDVNMKGANMVHE